MHVAEQREQEYIDKAWGPAIRVMDTARKKSYYREKDSYLPFHKYGVNLGTGRLSHESIYLPEMVEEGVDLAVFPDITSSINYATEIMSYALDMWFLWGFDGHVWVYLDFWVE